MEIVEKYEFVALDASDLIDKIKTRLEALSFTTSLYDDNIIGGINRGKRLHVQIGTGLYLNFGSGVNTHPSSTTSKTITNWASSQAVACNISRTFNSGLAWQANETTSINEINCVYTEDNCLCRIFVGEFSIAIVTNYSSIYYNTLYINWKDELILTSNSNTSSTPKQNFIRLFNASTGLAIFPEMIKDATIYKGNSNGVRNFEENAINRVNFYQIYDRLYNLINKASAIIPMCVFHMTGSGTSDTKIFLNELSDIGIINMKNTDAGFLFDVSGLEYQAFPDHFVDVSSATSMGIIFRIA